MMYFLFYELLLGMLVETQFHFTVINKEVEDHHNHKTTNTTFSSILQWLKVYQQILPKSNPKHANHLSTHQITILCHFMEYHCVGMTLCVVEEWCLVQFLKLQFLSHQWWCITKQFTIIESSKYIILLHKCFRGTENRAEELQWWIHFKNDEWYGSSCHAFFRYTIGKFKWIG